jgi:hypothetical protein
MSDNSTTSRPVIFPRNLTARAHHRVLGNPDISRPEDSVANCFPGLDMDLRNLDRRFFPGLVFEFISSGYIDEQQRPGALLLYPDGLGDTDLRPEYLDELTAEQRALIAPLRKILYFRLFRELRETLSAGVWYLDWVEQGGRRIAMSQPQPDGRHLPLDGLVVWRIVRGLEPGEVKIGLVRRDAKGTTLELTGWRRLFTSPLTGVLSGAYQPGELLMSMCSPWQHDFRDCACHYWASNRPDIVHGEVAIGAEMLPGDVPEAPEIAQTRLDWMRADRSPAAASATLSTLEANRPYQMDHFQINRTWQDLNIVLNNTEIGALHLPESVQTAEPFATAGELYAMLRDHLAPLEMTLALEYLYARFSLIPANAPADPRWPDVTRHAEFVRHRLLIIAVSEMQHVRWANELLWALANADSKLGPYTPVLTPAEDVPLRGRNTRKRDLRRLEPETLQQFIATESRSATIDGLYAQVVVTLGQPGYPRHLRELASRIIADGVQHYSRFRDIDVVLKLYAKIDPKPYLRLLTPGTPEQAGTALAIYETIQRNLADGYAAMAANDFAAGGTAIAAARSVMTTLLEEGEKLAEAGIGIPFWPTP